MVITNPPQTAREAHPAAELFPMMTMDELKSLAEDIKSNGLIEPIVLYEDKILDGRNRLVACQIAGVEPRYADASLNGSSPTLFAVSKNLHRRHLTTSQCATIAVGMLPLLKEEAKERQRQAAVNTNKRRANTLPVKVQEAHTVHNSDHNEMRGERREIAGKTTGVSASLVTMAARVQERDPDLFGRIAAGEVTVGAACRQLRPAAGERRQPANEQTATARQPQRPKNPNYHQERRVNCAKRRMIEVLSNVRGLCRGLVELNVSLVAMGLTSEEKRAWIAIGRETSRQLRAFARKLESVQ